LGERVLVTGGAGFIGCNLAHALLQDGQQVRVPSAKLRTSFDNLSRRGTERNLAWLQEQHPNGLEFVRGDVRDFVFRDYPLTPNTSLLGRNWIN
jgi:CDP-paratose 2-epimerase